MSLVLIAAADDEGRRLDRILRKALRDLPLSAIHRLLRQGLILVNGKAAAADRRIRSGETIVMETGDAGKSLNLRQNSGNQLLCMSSLKSAILFEGSGFLILNKKAGLAVHGRESLEEQVRAYLLPKIPPSLSFRPGPLHRIDKPSSGIIVFSTKLEAAIAFSALMRERKIKKIYLALVEGKIRKTELWQDELRRDKLQKKTFAGTTHGAETTDRLKTGLTRVIPLAGNDASTLIQADIETGRTHQIRAQAAFHGHPLLGDRKYGGRAFSRKNSSFMLHAWRMEFPKDLPLPHRIEAPLPEYFKEKIKELFGHDTWQ